MEIKKYDVFVIGSGVAGQTVAKLCSKEGLKVAIADNREYGGTCANRGCDPKKILLGPTEVYEMAKNLSNKNLLNVPEIEWKAVQKFKKGFTKRIPPATEDDMKKLGVAMYHQSPKFLNEKTLSVEGKSVEASTIVIATGLVPRPLTIEGADLLLKSDDFLALKKMPKAMVFIGAGYIGMELAHMAARFGSSVTIIDNGKRPLKAFDRDIVDELVNASKELGIQFIFNTDISKMEKLRKNQRLHYTINGQKKSITARCIFNSSGRIPAIETLDLEKGGVSFSENGITVNDYLQSVSNPDVYACGDVSSHSVPLTPLSGIEAKIVAENIINGNQKKVDVPVVPSAVFTLPNLASVGLLEEEAKKKYKDISVHFESVPEWYNAKRLNQPFYAYKTISNISDGRILGAHLLGPHASETINLFTMAINQGMTVDALKNTIFTYPSWGNDIKSMF